MRIPSFLHAPFRSAAILVGMVIIWIVLAPTQFGGQSSYVIIAGASMEPSLHWGDLVVARQSQTYEIGDVVTYSHPYVGPVIHRIIDVDGATFILQGDNNEWIDSYQPTRADIVGKSWITIPGAANLLQHLRTPTGLTLLSLAVGFIVLVTLTSNKRTDSSLDTKMKGTNVGSQSQNVSQMMDGWLFALAAILFGALLLGIFSFTRPLTEYTQVDIPYKHEGKFSYQGTGASSVYDYGRIEAGDPIFHTLTTSFDVSFDYEFSSPGGATSSGRYRLLLEVSEPNGWRREIELVPSTTYANNQFTTAATIDLEYVTAVVQSLEDQTGYNRSQFDVRITPLVISEASIAGHPLVEQFAPSLHFVLDDYQLYLDGVNPFEPVDDPLNPVQIGMQPEFHLIPTSMTILGLDVPVETARWIAGVAFSVALLGLGIILYPLIQSWQQGESNQIALQYRDILLDVDKLPRITAALTIDVSSFSDLAKLAGSHNALILHRSAKGKHTYLLRTDESAFRFVLKDIPPEELG